MFQKVSSPEDKTRHRITTRKKQQPGGPGGSCNAIMASRKRPSGYTEDLSSSEDEDFILPDRHHDTGVQMDAEYNPGCDAPLRSIRLNPTQNLSSGNSTHSNSSGGMLNNTENKPLSDMPVRRRGRAPSKRPCLNRNALMARENRQKKKEYIQHIENKLQQFQAENSQLNNTIQKQMAEIKKLTTEVAYLKNVLSNNTVITSLLRAMNDSLKKMNPGSGGSQTMPDTQSGNPDNDGLAMSMTNSCLTAASLAEVRENPDLRLRDGNKSDSSQINTAKICSRSTPSARKSMPISITADHTYISPKEEQCSSNSENSMDLDGEITKGTISLNSNNKFTCDKSEKGKSLDIRQPTNILDKTEISLSDTDFSQLSSFNVDLFDNFYKLDVEQSPLCFDDNAPGLFEDDPFLNTFGEDIGTANKITENLDFNNSWVNNADITNQIDDTLPCNNFKNAGICLHINSSRVSLEFCSICHSNSSKANLVY